MAKDIDILKDQYPENALFNSIRKTTKYYCVLLLLKFIYPIY